MHVELSADALQVVIYPITATTRFRPGNEELEKEEEEKKVKGNRGLMSE